MSARLRARVRDVLPGPLGTMAIVLTASALARFFWLARPNRQLIFDEQYYVNAARVIIGRHVAHGAPYAGRAIGLDPNTEHPPLGKLIIGGSMKLFGDNPLGWRFPSIVAGLVAIWLLYVIVRRAGGRPWLAVAVAATFSADNLAFVHSRIATLDILFVAPLLVAVWLYFRGNYLSAGAVCGIAMLVKLPAAYGLLGLAVLALVLGVRSEAGQRRWRGTMPDVARLVVPGLIIFIAGLFVLDLKFSVYDSPFAHIGHMVRYGQALSRHGGPIGTESYPWQWWANEAQIPYLRIDAQLSVAGRSIGDRALVYFRGAMNPAIIGPAFIGIGYAAARAWRDRDRLATWVVVWALANYLPLLVASLIFHRISYLYYMLPILPAIVIGNALLLWDSAIPRLCRWGYALAIGLGVLAYFPFRTVL